MSDPPPRYTPRVCTGNERRHTSTFRSSLEVFLLRFLISIVACTYGANIETLHNALSTSRLAIDRNGHDPSSFLSEDEWNVLSHICNAIERITANVKRQQFSSVTDDDLDCLIDYVVKPAIYAKLDCRYIIDLIRLYACHRGKLSLRHRVYYRAFRWHNPIKWLLPQGQLILTKMFVSDDVLIQKIAPNETIRVLLGSALAKTSDKYFMPWTDRSRVPRVFYVDDDVSARWIVSQCRIRRIERRRGN
ncbi:hypothetical protein FB567DRAFT_285525 [Paraphoma chrysanthemicola]|uniref:Uncharacterized protein n=1 Tax=Paraphoma chrysanthemicola TaxID=798071 RepID=A0A8K0RAK9_9PLEO|nr:hypothetical protein FB567DRAFT_285525 [Paraphoma chrysanthemicola]